MLLFFLSNIIFDIEVIHRKKDIRDLVYKELNSYDIKKLLFLIDYLIDEFQKTTIKK